MLILTTLKRNSDSFVHCTFPVLRALKIIEKYWPTQLSSWISVRALPASLGQLFVNSCLKLKMTILDFKLRKSNLFDHP